MTVPLRRHAIALLIAACAAPSPVAWADSAVGNDTTLGNALNGAVPSGPFAVDPEWLAGQRTPSGFLLDPPRRRANGFDRSDFEVGWVFRGWLEAGGLGGDADETNALFRMYKDLKRGAYANQYGFFADHVREGHYVEAYGGGIGRDDQFHSLVFGRANDWTLKAFFNETPHAFTSTYRSLWNGVGTGDMTLANPAALPPGGGGRSPAQVSASLEAVLAATPDSELALVRREGGLRFDKRLTESWKAFASVTSERRQGARPFGAAWGFNANGGNVEVAEPIDYTTHEFAGGLQFADALSALNLQATASLFRNRIDTLTFESPMAVAAAAPVSGVPPGGFTAGRFDLVPGNDYYSVQGDYARAFPAWWNARLTAVASAATSRQDDALVASTMLPGIAVGGITGGRWDATESLSRRTARARIDTRLVDIALALDPAPALRVNGRLRLHETDNATEYVACNPLTGQVGRLVNDGSASAVVTNAAGTPPWPVGTPYCNLEALLAYTAANGNVPSNGSLAIRSIPWEARQVRYELTADWRLGRKGSLNGLVAREVVDRSNRERGQTTEDVLKLGYVNRALDSGTLRLSWEHGRRRGSEYVGDPYAAYFSESLGALPASGSAASWVRSLASFRKYDLADRDQDIANARFILAVVPNVDAALSAQSRGARFPASRFGLTGTRRQDSLSVDVNWLPSTRLSAHALYGWQAARMNQASIWQAGCTIGQAGVTASNFASLCPAEGGPLYPLRRAWSADSRERNDTWGFGMRYDFQPALFDASFLRASGRTSIGYQYDANGLADSISDTQRLLAGSGMPDLNTAQTTFEASLLVPVTKTVSVRVLYRHERASIGDWHYDGVATLPTAGNSAYLDAGAQDYKANIIGLFLRVEL